MREFKVQSAMADVLVCSSFLAHRQGLDINQIIMTKMTKSAVKYPVHLTKGNARQYDEL